MCILYTYTVLNVNTKFRGRKNFLYRISTPIQKTIKILIWSALPNKVNRTGEACDPCSYSCNKNRQAYFLYILCEQTVYTP